MLHSMTLQILASGEAGGAQLAVEPLRGGKEGCGEGRSAYKRYFSIACTVASGTWVYVEADVFPSAGFFVHFAMVGMSSLRSFIRPRVALPFETLELHFRGRKAC